MRSLYEARTSVELWHNGRSAYQIAIAGRIVLPYDHEYSGRPLAIAFFIVLLMAWCVRGAMYFGLFSNYSRGS